MAINPDSFNINPSETKSVTDREGATTAVGSSPNFPAASPYSTFEVSVKKGGKASDVTETFTGPGTGIATGIGSPADTIGWVTTTGNKIAINGTNGAETIEIIHHSGAAIQIDADGSIFLMPTSRKGFGMHSNKGDGVVSAQGRLILKGHGHITIETEGSMEFNVGQNMFLNVGADLNIDVGGTMSTSVDGAATTEVVKDFTQTIGGIARETIAGDKRVQVAGDYRNDVGKKIETRAGQDIVEYSQKSIFLNAVESSSFEVSTGKLSLLAKDDATIATENALYVTSKNDVAVEAGTGTVAIRSGGNIVASSKASAFIDAVTKVDVRSAALDLSSTNQTNLRSGSMRLNSTSTVDLNATGAVDLRGSTIDLNKGSASPDAVNAVETTTPRITPTIFTPLAPEYPKAEEVIDSMTTERVAPDFPLNAKKMSAEDMAIYENEGDVPNPNAKAAAVGNRGGGSAYSRGSGLGTIPSDGNVGYDGTSNNSKAENSPYPTISSIYNSSEKLSRNLTVGGFPGLGSLPTNQMGYTRKEIVDNVKHLSYNIIDPVLEKFGSRVTLTHGIRLGQGGSRHYIGKAVDLRAANRSHADTAEIAKWIVENLPFERCFLEANHQGGVHIHVEAAPPGSAGARTVWTCEDPSCSTRINGLQLAFAQQGLRKMGYA